MRNYFEFCNFKKSLAGIFLVVLSSLVFGQSAPSSSSTTASAPAQNPNQVAILRWYRSNQAASFAAGQGAGQVVFDGSNVWVSNSTANTVTKLRASDETSLGEFAAGPSPAGMA